MTQPTMTKITAFILLLALIIPVSELSAETPESGTTKQTEHSDYIDCSQPQVLEDRSNRQFPKFYPVEGYQNSEYVYGEIELLNQGEIRGFLYRSNGEQTYVYGERQNKSNVNAYDQKGNVFLLDIMSGQELDMESKHQKIRIKRK